MCAPCENFRYMVLVKCNSEFNRVNRRRWRDASGMHMCIRLGIHVAREQQETGAAAEALDFFPGASGTGPTKMTDKSGRARSLREAEAESGFFRAQLKGERPERAVAARPLRRVS